VPAAAGSLIKGEDYLSLGELDAAGREADALVVSAPGDWRSHDLAARVLLGRAVIAERDGRVAAVAKLMREAADAYHRAIGCEPRIAGLWRNAADAAWLAGDRAEAVASYEQAMALAPDDPRAHLRLAQAAFEKAPDEARSLLQQVISLDASIAEAHASLALLDAQQGDSGNATHRIMHAVELAPDNAAIRTVQARVHRLLGNPAVGIEVLLAVPEGGRRTEPASEELASCWTAVGRRDRAADAWEACFRANAHRTDAWRFAVLAAEAALDAGDRGRAAALLDHAAMAGAPAASVTAIRARAATREDQRGGS